MEKNKPSVLFGLNHVQENDVFVITPSDHLVRDVRSFCKHIEKAEGFIKTHDEALITFGITLDYLKDNEVALSIQ